MGHPYRERHAQVATTTSDNLNGAQTGTPAKQQTAKSTTVAKKGKRSSK
jgi:hypothetical protein